MNDTSASPELPFFDPEQDVSVRQLEVFESLPDAAIDDLPVGVIQVDREGTILGYNKAEARLANRNADDVVGKNFFTEVAPCTNVQQFAGRFRTELGPDKPLAVFPFEFTFPEKRVLVTVLMHYDVNTDRGWIFVEERSGDTTARRRRK